MGTIIVLYNHDKKGIDEKLNDVGHDFIKSIIASVHVHLDKEQCLNIIVAKCNVKTMLVLKATSARHCWYNGAEVQLRSAKLEN